MSAAFGAVAISFAPVFVKWIAPEGPGPTAIAFWRMAMGGALVALLFRPAFRGAWRRPAACAALAGVFFACDLFCWHRAILAVGAGMATVLANTQVFWLGAWGALALGERTGKRFWLAAGLSLGGMLLLAGRDFAGSPAGFAFATVTGGFYAAYVLSLRRASALPPSSAVLVVCASASLALLASLLAEGKAVSLPTPRAAGLLAALALTGQCLGWVLISRGLPGIPASRAGLLLLLQPVLAMVWGGCLVPVPESLDAVRLSGAALTLAGVYLGGLRAREPSDRVPP